LYQYLVSGSGVCPNDTSNIAVTLNIAPLPPKAGFDASYCLGDSIVDITAAFGIGVYTWYSDISLTNVIGTGAFLTPNSIIGTTVYYVTDFDGTCESMSDSVIITITNCTTCSGNIALNPSFESVTALPTASGDYSLINDWGNAGSATGSPDYFHTNGGVNVDLPSAFFGDIMPATGDVIMGLTLMHGMAADYREYIDAPLSTPLIPGQSYNVSFYVSNGLHNGVESGMGSNNIGVHFSIGQVVAAGTAPLGITPSLNYNTIFYDSNWQYITFQYVPTTAEDHITIGNFYDDASTNSNIFNVVPLSSAYAYVVFDDICIIPSPLIVSNDTTICLGDSVELFASMGTSYSWAEASNLSVILDNDSAFTVTPSATTTYAVFNSFDTAYVTVTTVNCMSGCIGNVVPNSSFEFNSGYPTTLGLSNLVNDWGNANGGGTSDFLHTNGTNGSGLPSSYMADITPNTGDGVMAAFLYTTNPIQWREYIDVQLTTTLIPGQTYDVSFYMTNGVNNGIRGGLGANNIGVHFSVGALIQVGYGPIGITPTWNYSTVFYATNWQLMSFQYTPVSAVDHITIGNFYDDASTTTATYAVVTSSPSAYVFYDDFCITLAAIPLDVSNDTAICFGDSVTLLAFGGDGSYSWADSLNMNIILDTDSAITVSPAVTTTYAVFDLTDTLYVTVTVNIPPNAGINGSAVLCSNGTSFFAIDSLNGSPDLTGTWMPLLTGGIFDPSTNPAGIYTYTVTYKVSVKSKTA